MLYDLFYRANIVVNIISLSFQEILDLVADIDLAINLKCREDILIKRCLGRRVCTQCGKNFNVASIDVKGTNGGSRIHMPPVLPPYSCLGKLVTSMSDTEEILKEKLRIYSEQVLLITIFLLKALR
jgi:adenylate kinase